MNEIFEGFLTFGLGVEEFFLLFEEGGVGSADAEQAVGIDAVELCDFGGDVFKEVAVVADDDTGERGLLENLLEPLDSGEVEMVGGFEQVLEQAAFACV